LRDEWLLHDVTRVWCRPRGQTCVRHERLSVVFMCRGHRKERSSSARPGGSRHAGRARPGASGPEHKLDRLSVLSDDGVRRGDSREQKEGSVPSGIQPRSRWLSTAERCEPYRCG